MKAYCLVDGLGVCVAQTKGNKEEKVLMFCDPGSSAWRITYKGTFDGLMAQLKTIKKRATERARREMVSDLCGGVGYRAAVEDIGGLR